MKLIHISDTHNKLGEMIDNNMLPDGDVLIHSGDALGHGNIIELAQFNLALERLKEKYSLILYTPGNHDAPFEDNQNVARTFITNAVVLIDEPYEFNNVKFYGSPWSKWFYDWSFNLPRGSIAYEEAARRIWGKIPDDTNVLFTHGPPFGILDQLDEYGSEPGEHVGCSYLLERVKQLKELKVHCFGHIHAAYNIITKDGIIFANGASCNEQYKPVNLPHIIDLS